MVKVGINGFGRIGKLFFRAALMNNLDIEFVGINDLTDTKTLGTLLKYDTVFKRAPFSVEWDEKNLIVDGKKIPVSAERDPTKLKWGELGAEVVAECTGRFRKRDEAAMHIQAGAKKVVISAPAVQPDITVVLGVNFDKYDKSKHDVLSMGSCTTNSLGAPLKVIDEKFGITKGFMLTVHSFTNDQSTVDFVHSDLRRARCASQNLIFTTTGAAKAIGEVLPNLQGKIDGAAARIPTPDGSCSVVSLILGKETSKAEFNGALKTAAEGPLKGILEFTEDPIVTADIIGDSHTAIIDGDMNYVAGNFAVLYSWYDNEWGFSTKMGELITKLL